MGRAVFSLRERLWLLAHDDRYTPLKTLVDVRALNIGMVAATLIDLLMADRIRIRAGMVYVGGRRGLLGDPVGAALLAAVDPEQETPLADLLRAACTDSHGDASNPFQDGYRRTRTALITAGHLNVEQRLWRSPAYYLDDAHLIAGIRQQLNSRLVHHDRPHSADIDCLSALVLAAGLHHVLRIPYEPDEAEQILRGITDTIPDRAGKDAPLAAVPELVDAVIDTIGHLATAPF